MRKRHVPTWLLLVICILACQQTKEGSPSAGQATTAESANAATDRDSLRMQYDLLMSERDQALPVQQVIERGKVNPVDEAPLDTAFFVFREQLKKAVSRKDVFFLLDHIDPHIKNGFGGEDGSENFVTIWNLNDASNGENSDLWYVLERILRFGGSFADKRKRFYAPYFCFDIPDTVDPYESGIILGQGVRFRAGPSTDFRISAVASYEIVKILDDQAPEETINEETYPWYKVERADGKEGFVFGKFIGRPIDHRIGFERQSDGVWRMVFLVAGD